MFNLNFALVLSVFILTFVLERVPRVALYGGRERNMCVGQMGNSSCITIPRSLDRCNDWPRPSSDGVPCVPVDFRASAILKSLISEFCHFPRRTLI